MSDELFATDAESLAEFKALLQDPAARQAFVEAKARAAKSGAKVRYSHVLQLVTSVPWAIQPQVLGVIVDVLAFRIAGGRFTPDEIDARLFAAREMRGIPDQAPPVGSVAVLPLQGVLIPKAGGFTEMSGGTSLQEFAAMFRAAMADESVKAIVMDVDSPGGMASGVPDMAAEIRAARGRKPIVAIANHQASSAGYWLASQADKLYMTRSARVGSIGVYTTHENRAGEAAAKGVETTLISAGDHKTEGNPLEPLTDDAKAHMQSMVNEVYGMFTKDVAKGRQINVEAVRSEAWGQGRELMARQAVANGLVDGVTTLEAVVGSLVQQVPGPAQQVTASFVPEQIAITMSTGTEPLVGPDGEEVDLEAVAEEFGIEIPTVSFDEGDAEVTAGAGTAGEIEVAAQVDNSEWDRNRAMTECNSASDYRSICAGEHTYGTPDERRHWSLPHHYLGKGPNATGVRNALSRLPQAEQLANRERAQAHLKAHMRQINPDYEGSAGEQEPAHADAAPNDDVVDDQQKSWEAILDRADVVLGEKEATQ